MFGSQEKEEGGKGKQLTAAHVLAAQALAAGKTALQAAEDAGVHERTIENWKKERWFQSMQKDFVSSMVAAAKMELSSTTLLSKKNRLTGMQEIWEALRLKGAKAEKPGEVVAIAKAQLDILQAVSKEIGEEGQPLVAKDEETGLPFVMSLEHPGVIQPVEKSGTAESGTPSPPAPFPASKERGENLPSASSPDGQEEGRK